MTRRPPRVTRTDTLVPDTTLCRSRRPVIAGAEPGKAAVEKRDAVLRIEVERGREHPDGVRIAALLEGAVAEVIVGPGVVLIERNRLFEVDLGQGVAALIHQHDAAPDIVVGDVWIQPTQIGRASCGENVCQSVWFSGVAVD